MATGDRKSCYLSVDDEVLNFYTENGFLVCRECTNSFWCNHVEKAITTGADVETIWGPENEESVESQWVQVPIIPTIAQYAKCYLELNKKLHAYVVSLLNHGETGELIFLGFIHKPEARAVLRSVVVDWFRGAFDPSSLTCLSTSHSFAAQQRWNKEVRNPRTAFAQHWSVFFTQRCLTCAGALGDIADLVPSSEKASIW